MKNPRAHLGNKLVDAQGEAWGVEGTVAGKESESMCERASTVTSDHAAENLHCMCAL